MNQIVLRTNKGEYLPGEDVFGVVYLNIEAPTAGRGITLVFKGFEHFSYDYVSDGGKNKLEATKDYIDFDNVEVYSSTDPFALGSYTFPFKVTLPKVLPGSFHMRSLVEADLDCTVKYWLQASVLDSDMMASQDIVLTEALPRPVSVGGTTLSTNVEHIIRRFPFRKFINITVRLVESAVISGGMMKVRMIITNDSSVTVRSFKIQLLQSLVLSCKKDVPAEKLSPNISRLQQRTVIQPEGGPLVVRETGGSTAGMNPAVFNRVLDNVLIPMKAKDGQELPPTIHGNHIKCKYGLEILVMLSNDDIVRISHPVPCVLPKPNDSWQSWVAPEWTLNGNVVTSSSRFSVSEDQLNCESFSGLPGFQAL